MTANAQFSLSPAASDWEYTTRASGGATASPKRFDLASDTADIKRWIGLLQADAALTLHAAPASLPPAVGGFSDERGNTRPVDALLLAAMGPPEPTPPTYLGDMPDVRLWSAVLRHEEPVEPWLTPDSQPGPLLTHRPGTSLEVFTEAELCGLHALWSLARLRSRTDWTRRCLDVAAWHIRELQPDNATNMPWGIHVFVLLGLRRSEPLAMIEAESRLHNAKVSGGAPDRRSACILMHASFELEYQLGSS